MKIKLSVIVPAYNEESTIQKVLAKILKEDIFEIIVIDDGSTDQTVNLIQKIKSPKIKIIKHAKNSGKGAAIITGIKKARGTHIIIQDADLELDPKDYKKLLTPLKINPDVFVIGNRWYKNSRFTLTRLGNHYFSFIFLLLYFKRVKDPYCCYKIAPKKFWQGLNLESNSFEIEAEIVSKILALKCPISQLPVSYKPRTYREGKKIGIKDALLGTKLLLKLRFFSLSSK
jgi:glycosyltransferase involved in cell wall biosynthesis